MEGHLPDHECRVRHHYGLFVRRLSRRSPSETVGVGAALRRTAQLRESAGRDGSRYDDGEPVLAEAIVELRSAGTYGVSLALGALVSGRFDQGHFELAARDDTEALAEGRRAEHPHSIAVAMCGVGRSLLALGQPDAARPHLIEARERYEELTIAPGVVDCTILLGVTERDTAEQADDPDTAGDPRRVS